MMILSKKTLLYNTDGSTLSFEAEITDGYSTICSVLPNSKLDLTNEEVVQEALEVFYEKYFPKRAETEKFSQVDENLSRVDSKLQEYETRFEKIVEENKVMNGALTELILKLSDVLEGVDTQEKEGGE